MPLEARAPHGESRSGDGAAPAADGVGRRVGVVVPETETETETEPEPVMPVVVASAAPDGRVTRLPRPCRTSASPGHRRAVPAFAPQGDAVGGAVLGRRRAR
ncbi:hypothetical protein ABZX30_25060 [Streptomyces sp. NPDC004542]|uniref:hypothetical protein n=1 Tax=Streptomyces sp. NPDC004542 TaxID=3154281 RepID=UPI00339EF723